MGFSMAVVIITEFQAVMVVSSVCAEMNHWTVFLASTFDPVYDVTRHRWFLRWTTEMKRQELQRKQKDKKQKSCEQWMEVCLKAAVVVQIALNQSFQHDFDLWILTFLFVIVVDSDFLSNFHLTVWFVYLPCDSDALSCNSSPQSLAGFFFSYVCVCAKNDLTLQRHNNLSSLPVCGQ